MTLNLQMDSLLLPPIGLANGRGKRDGQPFQVTQGELNASEPPMRCREIHTDSKTLRSLGLGGQGQGLPSWTWLPFPNPAHTWLSPV